MAKKQKGDKIAMKEKEIIVMEEGDEITIVIKKEKLVIEKKKCWIIRLIHSNSFHLILLSSLYFLFNLIFLIFPLAIFNNANYAFESSLKLIFIICSIAMSWIGVTIMFIVLVRHLIRIKLIRFESETSKQDILKKEAYELTKHLIAKSEEKRNQENNQ